MNRFVCVEWVIIGVHILNLMTFGVSGAPVMTMVWDVVACAHWRVCDIWLWILLAGTAVASVETLWVVVRLLLVVWTVAELL